MYWALGLCYDKGTALFMEGYNMQHKCKVTVIDKKLYPELQAQYCADPNSGVCPIYNVGDEYNFERYGKADDFWHIWTTRLCTLMA